MTYKLQTDTPHFFFDDGLIAHQQRLTRRWLPAKIYSEPVIEPDRIWEGRCIALFGTVLPQSNGGYWMYYSSFTPGKEHAKVLLAQSEDGLQWHKPDLNSIEWRGAKANNLVFSPDQHFDSPSAIHEPDDAVAPYKMIGYHWAQGDEATCGLHAFYSEDGLRWQHKGRVLIAGDRTNIMPCKPDGKYTIYTRHPQMMETQGARAIYRSQSEDFQNWSAPELVFASDLTDEPDVEFYGMSVFERNGWHIGLLEYWRSDTDVLDTRLAVSRDGKNWLRSHSREPFIAPSHNWNRAWSSCASNGPIFINEQMVFYFGARATSHHYDSAQMHGVIGYASLPLDRFCGLEATTGGVLLTQPLQWPGGDLVLNADTRTSFSSHPMMCGGEIGVEVLNANGNEIDGWGGENRAKFSGNTHCRGRIHSGKVLWEDGRSLDTLKGQTIQLRFHLRHARLFTIEARTQKSE